MDKKTGKKMLEKSGKPVKPRCAKEREVVFAKLQLASPICIESFDQFPQLGRFTLRDEGQFVVVIVWLLSPTRLSGLKPRTVTFTTMARVRCLTGT